MAKTFYITTPLYYVNDAPHIGHTYTTVAADVMARYQRAKGKPVHFLTGTDEHGQKVFRKATERGLTPQAHVDELVQRFQKLWERLDCTHDDFIRTTEPRHTAVVQEVLTELFERGDIYKESYAGWYSTSAERFWTEKDVLVAEDGTKLCPDTQQPVEWLEETNYWFRMSKYADQLRAWAAEHSDWIRPESRKNELLGTLKKEIADLCITRPKERLPWGIPIPWDGDYVTYVWFDALLNYVSAIGYRRDQQRFGACWPADFQLLGKDILTTHTVYWGTMLLALGLDPAECLYAHGWWTVEGRKMSKSVGNVVDPNLLIDAYGADSVRYVLMAEKSFGGDGDFSHKGFQLRYNADLANVMGNLLHRGVSMSEKWLGGTVAPLGEITEAERTLQAEVGALAAAYDTHLSALAYNTALECLVNIGKAGNKYLDTEKPWALNKAGDTARLATVMRHTLEVCRVVGVLLAPFCPNKSQEFLARLGLSSLSLESLAQLSGLVDGASLTHGDPIFPRMDDLPAEIAAALEAAAAKAGPLKSLPQGAKGGASDKGSSEKKGKKKQKSKKDTPAEFGTIAFEDFTKVEIRVVEVIEATQHPNADRLLVVTVDAGEDSLRTIVAGIASKYSPDQLVGKKLLAVLNLAPRKLRGVMSQGMLLAASGSDGIVTMSSTLSDAPAGTRIS